MALFDDASLVVTPNGYKEGTLYSIKPTSGAGDMTVVRATTATRVNSAGLIELVPYNLLERSQEFGNAYWTAEAGNTITSNTTTAPDGTLTADTFTATASNELNVHNSTPLNLLGTFTYSIYLKNNGTNLIEAYLFKVGVGFATRGEINFSAGTFTASVGTGTIENVGNGWFRVSLTNTYTSGTFTMGTFTTSTTGTRSVYAWGAQLEQGTTAKDYFPTTDRLNVPRLDYSNGSCPSLLVEPQRTNLALYSEQFNNAAWGVSESTISANATVAPDGTNTADKLIESNNNAIHEVYSNTPFSLTSGVAYTKTVYAKSAERTQISLNFVTAGFAQGASVIANLTTGTLGTVTNYGSVTGSTATITNVDNGWYRISITMTPVTTANFYASFSIALSGNITYLGNGTSGIFIWGAQIEAGSYPTSYIPTTSATVTRNADAIYKTGISALIGQTEGTVFLDTYIDNIASQTNDPVLFYLRGVAEVYIEITSTGRVYGVFYNGTTSTGFINANIGLQNGRHKMAFGYKDNDFVLYVDGTQVGTDTSGLVSGSLTEFGLQYYQNTYQGTQDINSAVLFPTRLTNAELASLTTI